METNIYIDESGFTGVDLIRAEQPVFVIASNVLTDTEALNIKNEAFSGLEAIFPLASQPTFELKHSSFVRSVPGRERLVTFFKCLHEVDNKVAIWLADKEYALFCILIDQWIEWAFYKTGYDFYAQDHARYYARYAYWLIKAFERKGFLRPHLEFFQKMMREPSVENFEKFWNGMEFAFHNCHPRNRVFFGALLKAKNILGYSHLDESSKNTLDITRSGAVSLVAHWRNLSEGPFTIYHDHSSPMIQNKAIWEAFTHPENPECEFVQGGLPIKFPLNVTKTEFPDSHDFVQIQFSDLLAGAAAECTKLVLNLTEDNNKKKYAEKLLKIGFDDFVYNPLMAIPEFTPHDGAKLENAQEVIDYFSTVLHQRNLT